MSTIHIFAFSLIILCLGCNTKEFTHIEGETMGTRYRITADLSSPVNVDSLLEMINAEVNTYDPTSIISVFNQAVKTVHISRDRIHFWTNLNMARDIYNLSGGYFDPTIMPLVNYWGFGPAMKRPVLEKDSSAVDSLLQLVGFDKLVFKENTDTIEKENKLMELDFSALAKGYAVDMVAEYVRTQGSQNFLVEIGGEVVVRGYNSSGKPWKLAINEPRVDADVYTFIDVVEISDMAMASSGNYRNYYEVNGDLYGHTLDPITGFPAKNDLLAVTILAESCIYADALATACMAMGYNKSIVIIENLPGVEAAFYLADTKGVIIKKYSNGFIQYRSKS